MIAAPEAAQPTLPPVAVAATADFGTGVSATIAAITPVQATAQAPGEIGGPAISVTVALLNRSGQPIDLDAVTVTLFDSTGEVAIPVDTASAGRLHGRLPGGPAQGNYVFAVANDKRDPITVTVDYTPDAPTVGFTGPVGAS